MQNTYLIYKYTSPSGKSYIGQTKNIKRRIKEHRSTKSGCALFAKAICKYGYENFTLDILDKNLTLDEANILEEYYIDNLLTLAPNGYNLRTGGKNHKLTDIGRKNLSEAHKGIVQSEESKKKRSESIKGMKRSKETKEKLSISNTGKKHSEESKKKMSMSHTGKKLSKETKEKMSKSRSGTLNVHYGKSGQDFTYSKQYIITHPTGEQSIIFGLPKFCAEHNLDCGSMTKTAQGKQSNHKGFLCEYSMLITF